MTDAVWLALLVAIPSILTVLVPIMRARIDNAQKNIEREADWKRQDEIADRLAHKVSETARSATEVRNNINDKLDVVRTLVNGNVTDALRRELDGLQREVTLLEENRALKIALKQDINPVEAAKLELARAKVRELQTTLSFKIATDASVDGDHK